MKNNEYWLNKNSEDIVFKSVKGTYQLTKENFLESSPELTEQDYEFWKNWSDENYHQIYKDDAKDNNWREVITNIEESEQVSSKSAEADYIDRYEEMKHTYERIIKSLTALNLTEVQIRRYVMRHYDNLSIKKIAEMENVTYMSVKETLVSTEKKICKHNVNNSENTLKNTPKKRDI